MQQRQERPCIRTSRETFDTFENTLDLAIQANVPYIQIAT